MRHVAFSIALAVLFMASTIDPSYAARDKSGLMKASEVIGKKVLDQEGKKLGDVKDLVIEPMGGDIQYAVLDFGGFLGIGDKYFAVPWGAFKMTEGGKAFILDVSKRDLKKAPGFDKNNWPDMNDQSYVVTIYEFYEIPQPNGEKKP